MDKLTPRQNVVISETLCQYALQQGHNEATPERLKTLRRALVNELEAVTAETDISPNLPDLPSIV